MKNIVFLLIVLLFSCNKTELIETINYIEVVKEQPNITLSTIKDQIKPSLNTYNWWKDRSRYSGDSLLKINHYICTYHILVDTNIVNPLVYEFNLCQDKLEYQWTNINDLLLPSIIMCNDELEIIKLQNYYDSLQLSHYKYKDYKNIVLKCNIVSLN